MNFHKIIGLLPDNPLCGIDTNKDTLNLSTGLVTRIIKKIVLDGLTDFTRSSSGDSTYFVINLGDSDTTLTNCVCSHFQYTPITANNTDIGVSVTRTSQNLRIRPLNASTTTEEQFNQWIAAQYTAGTPVTVWYVLATPTTETITVPTGLSGTEEGYLNQSGTPTKTNPIYPTANTVEYWVDTPYYIRKTATDNIVTLPHTIYGDGTNASMTIKGNTVQNGTPTPTTPIQPSGCGDLIKIKISEPLCGIGTYKDELNLATGVCTRRIKKLVLDGTEEWTYITGGKHWMNVTGYQKSGLMCICSHYVAVENGSGSGMITNGQVGFYSSLANRLIFGDTNYSTTEDWKTYLAQQYVNGTPVTIWYVLAEPTTETITVPTGLSGTEEGYLNQSSTPTPTNPIYPTANGVKQQDETYSVYESYKIPILNNSQTTNVYLGETQSVRKIKKLVLTGQENWAINSEGTEKAYFSYSIGNNIQSSTTQICSHYGYNTITASNTNTGIYVTSSGVIRIREENAETSSLSAFTSFLTTQYAADTPVCVWYVLAEPTTGILNEPLMKIGDYADSVSASIPTTDGANSLNVPTTALQPSSVDVNYHGWHVADVHECGTITDTITTLPAVIHPANTTATVGLKGQIVQSGTPTPSNPVTVSGVGERTGNLLIYPYYSADGTIDGVTYITTVNGSIKANGTTERGTNFYLFRETSITAGTYTISINGVHSGMNLRLRDQDRSVNIFTLNANDPFATFTLENDVPNCTLYFNQSSADKAVNIDCTIMFNTGNEALPYELCGYKIPISSASTTTPVYLGEVSSTRQIKKVVFTGQEDWSRNTTAISGISLFVLPITDALANVAPVCTHYVGSDVRIWRELHTNEITVSIISGSTQRMVVNMGDVYTETEDFKTYLAQQYAAGTPVTVWYVLATPTTAIVNEPLMKIGDYVDVVANVSIPVTAGSDTLSAGTTVQPSEATITFKGWDGDS